MERILPSEAMRRFVQRVVGYAATGEVSEEVFAISTESVQTARPRS
jgi:hypothetical protein